MARDDVIILRNGERRMDFVVVFFDFSIFSMFYFVPFLLLWLL